MLPSKYVGAFIRVGHFVLMVQEHFSGYAGPRDWAFPGGAREAGETDFQAVSRELYEETKLRLIEGRIDSRLAHFNGFTLYLCELDPLSQAILRNLIASEGFYKNQGVGGERVRVTLVDPRSIRDQSGKKYVEMAFGSREWLPLQFGSQLEDACTAHRNLQACQARLATMAFPKPEHDKRVAPSMSR